MEEQLDKAEGASEDRDVSDWLEMASVLDCVMGQPPSKKMSSFVHRDLTFPAALLVQD